MPMERNLKIALMLATYRILHPVVVRGYMVGFIRDQQDVLRADD